MTPDDVRAVIEAAENCFSDESLDNVLHVSRAMLPVVEAAHKWHDEYESPVPDRSMLRKYLRDLAEALRALEEAK